jgi:hypothetical protein
MESAPKKSVSPGVVIVALVLVVAIAAAAWFQEELKGYWQLRAWEGGAARSLVTRFMEDLHGTNGKGAYEALDPTFYKPQYGADGSLHKLEWKEPLRPGVHDPRSSIPAGALKKVEVQPRVASGKGYFRVVVQFANDKWGEFRVERTDRLRITGYPDIFSDQPPPENFN